MTEADTNPDETWNGPPLDSFHPDKSVYSAADSFVRHRRGRLEGIFTTAVVDACFQGEAEPARNDCIRMVGRHHECIFGLIVDPETQLVIDGQVLQVNPVQARLSDEWDADAVERMQAVSKHYTGKVWNAREDLRIGNSQKWTPDDEYDWREYER